MNCKILMGHSLYKWAIPGHFFFIFGLFFLNAHLANIIVPLLRYEPRISGVRSNCSTTRAMTTVKSWWNILGQGKVKKWECRLWTKTFLTRGNKKQKEVWEVSSLWPRLEVDSWPALILIGRLFLMPRRDFLIPPLLLIAAPPRLVEISSDRLADKLVLHCWLLISLLNSWPIWNDYGKPGKWKRTCSKGQNNSL